MSNELNLGALRAVAKQHAEQLKEDYVNPDTTVDPAVSESHADAEVAETDYSAPIIYMEDDGTQFNVPQAIPSSTDENGDVTHSVTNVSMPTLDEVVKAYDRIGNDEIREKFANALFKDIEQYQKELIISHGLTPEEAAKASRNRMVKKSKEETTKYLEENPNLGIIKIDKSKEDVVEFTPEERDKMFKSNALQLVLVEQKELETLVVPPVKSEFKGSFMREILDGLAKYGLPMTNFGDFVTFRGVNSVKLANFFMDQDTTTAEMYAMQASLVYDALIGGTVLKKFDDANNVILSYEEFINTFPYTDLAMAVYAVLCASTDELLDFPLECSDCGAKFTANINIKGVLNMGDENTPEVFKDRIDRILSSRQKPDVMEAIRNEANIARRIATPDRKYIYVIQQPSIAKAISVTEYVSRMSRVEAFYSALIMWVKELYVYSEAAGGYMKFTDAPKGSEVEEDVSGTIEDMIEVLCNLPEKQLNILDEYLTAQDIWFTPTFRTKVDCEGCHTSLTLSLDVATMVFRRVRDTLAAMIG